MAQVVSLFGPTCGKRKEQFNVEYETELRNNFDWPEMSNGYKTEVLWAKMHPRWAETLYIIKFSSFTQTAVCSQSLKLLWLYEWNIFHNSHNIPAPNIMHGNGETPATYWPDCDCVSYMQPCVLVSNTVSRLVALALLYSCCPSKQCPAFMSTTDFLAHPLLTSHRLSLVQH